MAAYAHSYPNWPEDRWHLLEEHLREVGRLGGEFAAAFDPESAAWARLAGQWHDLGKYAPEFQDKLRSESGGPDAHIEAHSRVDHSSAGAVLALQKFQAAGRPLAWVIAGHHAGLADQPALFHTRLPTKGDRLDRARRGGAPALLEDASCPSWPAFVGRGKLTMEFWIRMLFSSVVDADFLDTEAWFAMCDGNAQTRRAARTAPAPSLLDLRERLAKELDRLAAGKTGPVADLRKRVLQACVNAGRNAELRPGHFSLTVPTGGGKTYASLAFALEHALSHGLRRVIVVIPYTSIIEQTADAFRRALGVSEAGPVVVEHHSALDPADPARENLFTRVASENWDAPIIVTTSVQFFESLFANRSQACRKLHNIARSVVVLDEVQSLPREMLDTILDGMNELAHHYGVSTVLSTATQPALLDRAGFRGLSGVREIIPAGEVVANFHASRARVQVRWPSENEQDCPVSWKDLAERIAREPSALAIVHLRDDARQLTVALDRILGDTTTVHLSALLYPQHRRTVLSKIRRALYAGEPCRVVSTQVVEAGVDLDFPVVFRALAGADSLAQAAGRCNREARLRAGHFEVFVAPTAPPSGILRQGLIEMKKILRENSEPDLFDPDLYRMYFQRLYSVGTLDRNAIQADREGFLYETVAKNFRMIPDPGTAIVVPIDGEGFSAEACRKALDPLRAGRPTRDDLRRLQPFTVTVYSTALERLEASGAIEMLPSAEACLVRALRPERTELYDQRLGLLGADPSVPLIA